jgi:purine-binding chemotaxis protein CheW
LASIESTAEFEGRRYLFFAVAGRLCACDLESVREIVASRPATRLPGAADWVRGVINLRGTLLTVVDLAPRFLGASDAGDAGDRVGDGAISGFGGQSIIVTESGGRSIGLGVDSVRNVMAVREEAMEAVDAQRAAGGIVSGLAHLGEAQGGTALVCDVGTIMQQALAG